MQVPIDSKPRWTRRKEARPQEVLAAALDLFVERGFAATRLEDVARRAGVSKGTLYLYFANKEELFKAMVRETIVPALGEAEQSIAGFSGRSADLLRDILMAWWDEYGCTKLAGVSKLLMSECGNFPELANFYNAEVVARGNAVIGRILARGIASGEFRPVDTDTMTLVLTAPIVSLIMWTHSMLPCATQLDPRVFLHTFIDLSLRGLAPDAPASPSTPTAIPR
jgi:AcrR family transcriptional regulator